jgi:hypothetical protein
VKEYDETDEDEDKLIPMLPICIGRDAGYSSAIEARWIVD